MAALTENAITKVATVTGVDMKTVAKTILYAVPPGKTFYPIAVCVRNPSATLAGGTDYSLGTGADADTWLTNNDLSGVVNPTDYALVGLPEVTPGGASYASCAAGSEFGIKPVTGSTGAATATIDVFGFLA